ncbi:MAG TPA: GyrI-like domain-containing protein [Streptosporangiaceae bacterium]|nr:GyrI-like domain-containing protein [Streptosporangiaceae bacterium]
MGRVTTLVVPAMELAIKHAGAPADADRAYASLATYVTRHALAVDGPMREYYLVGPRDTPDHGQWRTEIGWPVFRTGAGPRTGRPPGCGEARFCRRWALA